MQLQSPPLHGQMGSCSALLAFSQWMAITWQLAHHAVLLIVAATLIPVQASEVLAGLELDIPPGGIKTGEEHAAAITWIRVCRSRHARPHLGHPAAPSD